MNRIARPRLAWSSASRLRICAWTETSSAETGSSATMSAGDGASAAAMPTRWRWPPDSSCGRRSASARRSPTRSSSSATRAVALRRRPDRAARRAPRARCRPTVQRGSSEPYGSWNTGWTRRRSARGPCPGLGDGRRRRTRSRRPSGRSAEDAAAERASCPSPDSPTTASISPGATSRSTPSTAWTRPRAGTGPDRTGKCLTSPSTCRSARSEDEPAGPAASRRAHALAPPAARSIGSSGPRPRRPRGVGQPARDVVVRGSAASGGTRSHSACDAGSAARTGSRAEGRPGPAPRPAITRSAPRAWPARGQRGEQRLRVRVARRAEELGRPARPPRAGRRTSRRPGRRAGRRRRGRG